MITRFHIAVLLTFIVLPAHVHVAQHVPVEDDPCGFRFRKDTEEFEFQLWGYFRDALMSDLQRWALHPWVNIDVIGSSVRGAPLYHIVLTNPSSTTLKKRIWIHARTHPIEAESSWLARAMMDELLSGSMLSASILDNCVVHVLPMLNPDGVELLLPRTNARGVDLESNWGASEAEPEVQALRAQFELLMASASPIDIALNLHSAYDCKRYFVYHAAAGTSELFASMQQSYIGMVRKRFPEGIQAWDYFVSWTTGTPDRYPESWFWLNHRERVMALTFEEMNCTAAGEYDRTARALLGGSAEYLGLPGFATSTDAHVGPPTAVRIAAYPNPLRPGLHGSLNLRIDSPGIEHAKLDLVDALGRIVATVWDGPMTMRTHVLSYPVHGLRSGSYFIRFHAGDRMHMHSLLVLQ